MEYLSSKTLEALRVYCLIYLAGAAKKRLRVSQGKQELTVSLWLTGHIL